MKALVNWVHSFMLAHDLYPESGKALVCLSGGPDSMLLSHCLIELQKLGHIKRLRFLHVDHGLRENSSEHAFTLKKWANDWGWDLHIVKLKGAPKNNQEMWARLCRKDIVADYRNSHNGEVVFTGHNIDDSFEWFLRQQVSSSQGNFTYGIPLKNNYYRRPFHCLSSKQIRHFIKDENIPVLIDESNNDSRYQRNYLRKNVKAPLLKAFPKGLAHYVERANEWAQSTHAHPQEEKIRRLSPMPGVVVIETFSDNGINGSAFKSEVLSSIKELSSASRGEIRQNLAKLLRNSAGRRGPFSFSGGVKVYCYGKLFVLVNAKGLKKIKHFDKVWSHHLKEKTLASQIPFVDIQSLPTKLETLGGMPFVIYENKNKKKNLKGLVNDPLFPKILESARQNNLELRPLSFLLKMAQGMNCRAFLLTRLA